MGSRRLRNSFIYLLITVAIVAIVVNLLSSAVGGDQEIGLNDVVAMTARGNVDTIEVKGDDLMILTTSGETLTSRKESGSSIVEILQRGGVDLATSNVEIISRGQSGLSSILSVLFNFLPLVFFGAVLLFMMRSAQGNSNQTFSFGRSKARMFMGNSPQVSFSDVAGVEEAKEELEEVVEYLRSQRQEPLRELQKLHHLLQLLLRLLYTRHVGETHLRTVTHEHPRFTPPETGRR